MSYANGTPFLNLAQTVGTDHRDWFDENAAKLDLDTKMKTLWDGAADTATILASLQESVASLDTDVTTLQGVVSGHTSTITTINESLVLINTALNALNTQVTNKFDSAGIADPYDATHGIYAVGDVVTYNGQRYVCSTAVTAAEPFDVSKWTAEDVQSVIDHLVLNYDTPDISVTANGVKTNTQLLNELYALVDRSKFTKNTKLVSISSGSVLFFNLDNITTSDLRFGSVHATGISNVGVDTILMKAADSTMETGQIRTGNEVAFTDISATVPASGAILGIIY